MDTETLTCRVSEARADYGITQQQLADATGISVRTIISIEKGHQLPSLLSAMRIANYFSLTVDQLFEYKKTSPATSVMTRHCSGSGTRQRQ